jgi:hypothetical protein
MLLAYPLPVSFKHYFLPTIRIRKTACIQSGRRIQAVSAQELQTSVPLS